MNRKAIEARVSEDALVRRLERHPAVEAWVARMQDLIENTGGDLKRADDAERQAIEELRRMGQEVLGDRDQGLANEEARQLKASGQVVRQVKKLRWHCTFGEIQVIEQTYVGKHDGKLRRPFGKTAAVQCRGYSGPLQRVITEFGADNAFGRVAEKLAEPWAMPLQRGALKSLADAAGMNRHACPWGG